MQHPLSMNKPISKVFRRTTTYGQKGIHENAIASRIHQILLIMEGLPEYGDVKNRVNELLGILEELNLSKGN